MNPFSVGALFLRRRSVWEAADSGVLLWRKSFIHFIPFFALPLILIACALWLLPGNTVFLAYFTIWWLKPLFDRMVLHVVSARFFAADNDSPFRYRDMCKGLFAMRRGLLGDLLWRRFSPYRAALLPIRVLERSDGAQFKSRKNALASGGLNFCALISAFGLILEAILLAGEAVFAMTVTQMILPSGTYFFRHNMHITETLIFAAFCMNYILVGSLYVCMGFGLYINSRVEVEGWDLQLLFQKFAAAPSAAPAAFRRGVSSVTAVLLFCVFFALPQTAYANGGKPDGDTPNGGETQFTFLENLPSPEAYSLLEVLPSPDAYSLDILHEILESPDFGGSREGWGIYLRDRGNRQESPTLPSQEFLERMQRLRQAFAYVLRGVAILAAAGLAVFALYWYRKNRRKGITPLWDGKNNYAFSPFSPEEPEALFSKADDLFKRGNLREAWAACLAGCIGACAKYHALSFPPDATEYSCRDLVRRLLPARAEGFSALVQTWVLFAYGGRPPGEDAFEKALCYGRSLLCAAVPVRAEFKNETQGGDV